MNNTARKRAVITGASSGLGDLFAKRFAARGFDLVIAARRGDRLERLAQELRKAHAVSVQVVVMDLFQPDAARRLAEAALEGGAVDLLVNNAGFGPGGAFEDTPLERNLACIRVNVDVPVELTGLLLPMLKQQRGAILNVASTSAFQPVPYHGVYAATKAFILHFSEALGEELRGRVQVTAVCPGPTATGFYAASHPKGLAPDLPGMVEQTAEQCVEEALRGFDAGRRVVVTGGMNKVGSFLGSKGPRGLVRRVTAQIFKRAF